MKQGELLPNYYAVAPSELANAVALISGQGPNDQTAANCPTFSDITPGTLDADKQVTGSGCVYPTQATTLPDELVSNGNSWKAYVEDVGNGAATDPKTCRHPALGQPDPAQAPQPNDAYVTWRNPFVYFHSLIDTTSCSDGRRRARPARHRPEVDRHLAVVLLHRPEPLPRRQQRPALHARPAGRTRGG